MERILNIRFNECVLNKPITMGKKRELILK